MTHGQQNINRYVSCSGHTGLAVESARLLRLWVRIPSGSCTFVVSVAWCQVEDPVTG
jgi:hypothetical protein